MLALSAFFLLLPAYGAYAGKRDVPATASSMEAGQRTGTVHTGDPVRINYTVTLEDGSLVSTTYPSVAEDKTFKRSGWMQIPREMAPAEILAGEKSAVPGLGEGVIGMAAGEKKRFEVIPSRAYGENDLRKVIVQPRENTVPRSFRVQPREYEERFNAFPVVGKEIPFLPHVTARVAEVGEQDARLDVSGKDGDRFEQGVGMVELHVAADNITFRLFPKIGAAIDVQGETGRVVSMDDNSYTIDFNHPLAGKKLLVDLEVVSFENGADFRNVALPWIENHDQALLDAKQAGKPVLLVLYADWCQWCKRLLGETMQDPRIKKLKDKFVWMKLNSDKETKYKQIYRQKGFPMVVILRPDGTVAEKIDGFRDGAALSRTLKDFLESSKPGEAGSKTASGANSHG